MLLDVRKLIFSDELLQQALLAHCKTEGKQVPNSPIQKIHFTPRPAGGSTLVVDFMTSNPKKPYELHLNESFVLTAMILVCKRHGVPLPRDAAKIIQATDQGLAMIVSMKINTNSSPQKVAI
ncbi:hypothetical protein [Magnetovibrio blakemorei]|uniref:Uncharacterized protein n=1 Tax=Magnetovibrio blakemorei TaxID=28181 RepID=A0A1E5QC74_9PROT|nr:hypothetical protein [Magnetovibrio blakemorei]OEJ69657.1 hypothetical protein BEN30_02130 [Magnetovibrio blakemorei]